MIQIYLTLFFLAKVVKMLPHHVERVIRIVQPLAQRRFLIRNVWPRQPGNENESLKIVKFSHFVKKNQNFVKIYHNELS